MIEWINQKFFPDGFSYWHIVGAVGGITFFSRFFIQWIVSEIKKESVIPVAFWYLSIIGSLLLALYAYCYLSDPVFTVLYLPNFLIYIRNLYLIYSKQMTAPNPD